MNYTRFISQVFIPLFPERVETEINTDSTGIGGTRMGAIQLTEEQKKMCAQMGVAEADFIATLQADGTKDAAEKQLNQEERHFCASLGVSAEDFVKNYQRL